MDHKDAITDDIKTAVDAKISALKDVKDKDDNDAIKTKTQELSTEMQKIGEAVQQKQSQQSPTDEPKQDENIRDAEMPKDDTKSE